MDVTLKRIAISTRVLSKHLLANSHFFLQLACQLCAITNADGDWLHKLATMEFIAMNTSLLQLPTQSSAVTTTTVRVSVTQNYTAVYPLTINTSQTQVLVAINGLTIVLLFSSTPMVLAQILQTQVLQLRNTVKRTDHLQDALLQIPFQQVMLLNPVLMLVALILVVQATENYMLKLVQLGTHAQ